MACTHAPHVLCMHKHAYVNITEVTGQDSDWLDVIRVPDSGGAVM